MFLKLLSIGKNVLSTYYKLQPKQNRTKPNQNKNKLVVARVGLGLLFLPLFPLFLFFLLPSPLYNVTDDISAADVLLSPSVL